MPSSASISIRSSIIFDFSLSMPRARDSTTSTSENLSTTSPGRKSASPNIILQEDMSTVFFLYSQAVLTLSLINSSSILSRQRASILTVIFEFVLIKPAPILNPSKSSTLTISPFSNSPSILSISLSKIQAPPALIVRPSPFLSITVATV